MFVAFIEPKIQPALINHANPCSPIRLMLMHYLYQLSDTNTGGTIEQ